MNEKQVTNWDDDHGNDYSKALNSMKQVTQIRKIIQQTLSPVIKKIQEHISHLLSQSTILRNQTSILQEVQSTNLQYKKQIETLKTKINQIQTQIIDVSQQQTIQRAQSQKFETIVNMNLDDAKKDRKQQTQKIKKLTELNQSQTQLFDQTKSYFSESFNKITEQLSQFYRQQIKFNQMNDEKFGKIQVQIESQKRLVQNITKELKEAKSITTLYSSQRLEIRSHIQDFIELNQLVIRRQEYQKDKKIQRIEHQFTKDHIEKMLSETLTPEVRKFLPTLIQNIELLKRIEKQIKKCSDEIEISKQVEKSMFQKILQLQNLTKKQFEEKQIEIKKLSMHLETQFTYFHEEFNLKSAQFQQKFDRIDEMVKMNKLQTDLKFNTFIERNKTIIHAAVVECKPLEQRQEEERIKKQLVGFDEKITEIYKKENEINENILQFRSSLDQKLDTFHNRITKARSDLKVENEGIKKIVESFNVKLQESDNKMHQQSKIISKLLQVSILNTSLQIDEEYFNFSAYKYGEQNNETYISFYDGVIYEANGEYKNNEWLYRKKKINKEVLKRALLKQEAKLIDFITQKLKNWKWQDQKERPSHFFIENIFPAYESMITEKKPLLQARQLYEEKTQEFSLRIPEVSKFSQKRSQKSLGPGGSLQKFEIKQSRRNIKGPNDDKNILNTSIQALKGGVSLRQKGGYEANPHMDLYATTQLPKPNRIKLKRIDQNGKTDKNYIRNRYSLGKRTIQ